LGGGSDLEKNRIHIKEPGLGILLKRSGQENVSGIEVGMTDSLPGAVLKKPSDGRKDSGTIGRLGACRKEGGKVTAFGEIGGDDVDPPQGADRIKKNGLDLRSGNFLFGKDGGTIDFTTGSAGIEVEVACEFSTKTSMDTGAYDDPDRGWNRQKSNGCTSRKKTVLRVASGSLAKRGLGIQFLPCGEEGFPKRGADPSGSGRQGVKLESLGRRRERTHG
jgi:hypothetical protein